MTEKRTYRNLVHQDHLPAFRVVVKETDLWVHAPLDLKPVTRELILQHRGYVEAYIRTWPEFAQILSPWQLKGPAPTIITDMVNAGQKAGVGPMAAIAGAIAEQVGQGLLSHTDEVIIENGGDIFLKTRAPVIAGIYAGRSPLSLKIGIKLDACPIPLAVCTSSGTVGHSLSLGKADAVCVVSHSCSLADAVATSIGNLIHTKSDVSSAIEVGRCIDGIDGLAIIMGDEIGLWGGLELIPLKTKKG